METEAHIINLAAKKLGGDASNDELAELNQLLAANPEVNRSLKNVFTLWEIIDLDITIADKEIDDNIALVHNRIQDQIGRSKKP
jgi:hypothetical protein